MTVDHAASRAPVLRLGFVRGVEPNTWAERWRATTGVPLELVPLTTTRTAQTAQVDVMLERVAPEARPNGALATAETPAHRHAVRLYDEAIALVVAKDHELAQERSVDADALALVSLIVHPHHLPTWPAPDPWLDPAWAPTTIEETLELVATGAGAALMPAPLAKHASNKRLHAVLRIDDTQPPLAGTQVWATWEIERDDDDVQRLIGIFRGRRVTSSR